MMALIGSRTLGTSIAPSPATGTTTLQASLLEGCMARPDLERGDPFNRHARLFLAGGTWTDPNVHVHTQRI
jgi:hypothetical protein